MAETVINIAKKCSILKYKNGTLGPLTRVFRASAHAEVPMEMVSMHAEVPMEKGISAMEVA
jgi:hypothetical protein